MNVPRLSALLIPRLAALSLALLSCLALASTAPAQAQAPPTDGVRVIDIKWIFQHHERYKAASDALKREFEATANRLQEERKAIMNLEKQIKEMVPNSPDAKRLDEDLVRRKMEWQVQGEKQQKDFQARSAEMTWNVYYEVQQAVQAYCRDNNIGLVLQFNGDPIDPTNPKQLAAGINRYVVHVAPNRDITPHILRMVQRPAGPPANNQPIGVVPRPAAAPGQF